MSYWDDLVSAALLGTARSALAPPAPGDALGDLLANLDDGAPEALFLAAAAAVPLHRRAGFTPPEDTRPIPEAAPLDDLPRCSARAAEHLRLMIVHGHHRMVLPEWLAAVAAAGLRVHEDVLPDLLSFGREKPELRDAILEVLGARGRWLARQGDLWSYWHGDLDVEQTWHEADFDVRLGLLRWLRGKDPDRARELLAGTWDEEDAADRYKFLAAFEKGLSMADEPFLEETALDDPAKRVRKTAAKLLAALPGSRLGRRMVARIAPRLRLIPAGGFRARPQLAVTPSAAYDESMQRDGIPEAPSRHLKQTVDPKTWRFLLMLEVVPPSLWAQTWKKSPAELVEIATKSSPGGWRLMQGWAKAAARHKDIDWAEALLPYAIAQSDQGALFGLMGVIPPPRREAVLLAILENNQKPLRGSHPALTPLRFCAHKWSETLARAVLENWRRYLKRGNARPDPDMRDSLSGFAHYMPPSVYDEAHAVLTMESKGGRVWENAVSAFLALLQFRRDMLEAIGEAG